VLLTYGEYCELIARTVTPLSLYILQRSNHNCIAVSETMDAV